MNTITDYAGNTYPASRLQEMESPSFDSFGARQDRAYAALPGIVASARARQVNVGSPARVTATRGKNRGKEGVCFWRGKSQSFGGGRRYGSSLDRAMADALGARDRVGIKTAAGEKFFIDLNLVQLLP